MRFVPSVQSEPLEIRIATALEIVQRQASFRMPSQNLQNRNLKTYHTPRDVKASKNEKECEEAISLSSSASVD
ncbi:MAG: hypothetical protein QOI87_3765 [Bradyrhizobium sp.]|jgi:hypothetical protein|nr:hypothetical protein [Bradyrhizobium sp.]